MQNILKNLSFTEFKQLVDFLKDIYQKQRSGSITGKQEEKEFVCSSIGRFFPSLTALQEVRMMAVIDTMKEEDYILFKEEYPDIEIDTTGKGVKREKHYWEITLESLEQLYLSSKATEKNPASKQVIESKELNCLRKEKYGGYVVLKPLFLKQFGDLVQDYKLGQMEKFLTDNFGKDEAALFLGQFLGYCWQKKKFPKTFGLFADHLIKRFDCMLYEYIENEHKIERKANAEFLKNIELVIKQYFIKNISSEDRTDEETNNS